MNIHSPKGTPSYNQLARCPKLRQEVKDRTAAYNAFDLSWFSDVPAEIVKRASEKRAKAEVFGERCGDLPWALLHRRACRADLRMWSAHTTQADAIENITHSYRKADRLLRGVFEGVRV